MSFESLDYAPADPILGLSEAFEADTNPDKINLGIGVYKDAAGVVPVLNCVKEAEKRLLEAGASKSYLPMQGSALYGEVVQALLFGDGAEPVTAGRVATAQTPGGTGALRVAGDYLHTMHPQASVWLPNPTWANHPSIFDAAGVPTQKYPYLDSENNSVAFDAMLEALAAAAAGDVVLLHGCCQNPTGADLSLEQWQALGQCLVDAGLIPLVDLAYQGFAEGVEEDAGGLRVLGGLCPEMFVCSSFSKNLSVYNERVGALSVVGATADSVQRAFSHVKLRIRTNYSNPPAHGGAIVTTVMSDASLREQWLDELRAMRERINGVRRLLVDALHERNVPRDFSYLAAQRGMFSFSGLTTEQVRRLKDEFSIYVVGSGRINVAGLTETNLGRVADAMASVLIA